MKVVSDQKNYQVLQNKHDALKAINAQLNKSLKDAERKVKKYEAIVAIVQKAS